ncbi:MAG: ABC transporter permease [Beutenbergiaceae bacterium]
MSTKEDTSPQRSTTDLDQPSPAAGPSPTQRFLRNLVTEHLIWPIVVVIVLLGSMVDGFLTVANFTNLMWAAAPLGCMVLGLYFVMMTGRLDLSLESTYALAPTIAVLTMVNATLGLHPLLAILLTIVVGGVLGLINGFLSITMGVNPFLVTLATLLIYRGFVVYLIPEGVYGLPDAYTFLGGARLGTVPVAVLVLLALIASAWFVMKYTSWGRNLMAIGNNEDACRVAGINVAFTSMMAFVVAGACAALGGLLSAGQLYSIDASMGDGEILTVFAGVTLGGTALNGGRGRVTGLLGSLIVIGGITNLMNLIGIDATVRQIVFGLVLLFAIMLSSLQDRLRAVRS